MEFKKNEYGEIKYEDFKQAIEFADNIDEVASLRSIIEEEFIEHTLELSTMLSEKEVLFGL